MINARIAFAAMILASSLSLSAATHPNPLLTVTASGATVRYAGWGEVREMRLEVFDEAGTPVFDSSFSRGNLLDYALTDGAGDRLSDGTYLFVVTIRDLDDAQSQKFGTLHIADRRVILQNGPAETLSPAHVQALQVNGRAPSMTPVDRIGIEMPADPPSPAPAAIIAPGASSGPAPAKSIMAIPRADVSGTGALNRVTKWLDTAGTLGNSAITEVAGKVGIGTTNPGGQLHVFGPAAQDIFSGMGPDVQLGPAMNYGYSGGTFGRGVSSTCAPTVPPPHRIHRSVS